MRNINSHWILLVLAFFTFSCHEELVEPQAESKEIPKLQIANGRKPGTACTSDFYYYNKDKVMLGSVLTNNIIIGFPDGYTLEQKSAFVAKYSFLTGIESENNSGSADATVVSLEPGLACADVINILAQLEMQPEVRYATPFYASGEEGGSMGVTNQFIVNLKTNADLADLQKLVSSTNTQIIEQLGDFTYILSADKNAEGNALEMANYFANQSKVESSEPDFLYFYSTSQMANN